MRQVDRHTIVLRVIAGVLLAGFLVLAGEVVRHPNQSLPGDDAVAGWLTGLRSPVLTVLSTVITWVGWPWTLFVVGIVTALVLWWRGYDARRLLVIIGAWAGTAGAVTLLKVLVARERPSAAGVIGTPAWNYSFPSGHTTDSAVVYVLIALALGAGLRRPTRTARTLVAVLAGTVAVLIALTRVYLGYHWFTDLVGGWLLAGAVLCLSGSALRECPGPEFGPPRRLVRARPALAPAPLEHRAQPEPQRVYARHP